MKTPKLTDWFLALREAGELASIDIEFCRFLLNIDSQAEEEVLLAACLTSAAYRDGNVCIQLQDYAGRKLFTEAPEELQKTGPHIKKWIEKLNDSTLVGLPGDFKPLILDDQHRLYMHKLWHNEQKLVQQILAKVEAPAPEVDKDVLQDGLNRLFSNNEEINWQQVAAVAAVFNTFTVISGGPGTGKTTTVVRLLALLLEQGRSRGELPSIALAAPTGKAAARLENSILEAREQLQTDEEIKQTIPVECVTIHQLLGASRHTAHFRFNEDNPLPYDYVIIDEVSMVDQALMCKLMNAMLTKTRLLLLGDKDQLASVEAGSVLGDLCGDHNQNKFSREMQSILQDLNIHLPNSAVAKTAQPLIDNIILLTKSYRFEAESGIGQLAKAVNRGQADEAWALVNNDAYPEISATSPRQLSRFIEDLAQPVIQQFKKVQAAGSPSEMLEHYRHDKILAAHRKGFRGVNFINSSIERMLKKRGFISPYEEWYEGRPVIINTNNYRLGLSNGDLGVCGIDQNSDMKVFFENNDGLFAVSPARLPDYATAFALTVHKSQGSEFNNIYFVLPEQPSKILSRELIYTAISRARKQVRIFGPKQIFLDAVRHTAARKSGLKDYLWK